MGIGLPELIVIMVILLLLFGAKRLPKLSRSAGESIKEFKKGIDGAVDLDKKKISLNDKPSEAQSTKQPEHHTRKGISTDRIVPRG